MTFSLYSVVVVVAVVCNYGANIAKTSLVWCLSQGTGADVGNRKGNNLQGARGTREP